MKTIFIKLTKAGPTSGPFDIYDQSDNVISSNVLKKTLVSGIAFRVADSVIAVKIVSIGDCQFTRIIPLEEMVIEEYINTTYDEVTTGCLWRHLTNIQLYNSFYGKTEPYVLEYPVAFKIQDEIFQSYSDYTRAYQYLPNPDGVFNQNTRIETDDRWFDHSIIYNSQQCSGMLNLVPKPLHNLKEYMSYPKFNSDSKTILYAKSDNLYKFNGFFDVVKDKKIPLFNPSCVSLSMDKELNQSNMDYGMRSFQKSPLRAKEVKIRMILKDSCTTHLVSQFILGSTMLSYK